MTDSSKYSGFSLSSGTSTRIACGLDPGVTVRRDVRRRGRRVTHSSARFFVLRSFSRERVVVLRGQGCVERSDAWRSTDRDGAPPTADSGSRCSRDSVAGTGWLFHKLENEPQNVGQSEGEGCSAEACCGPLRGEVPRACRRGSVITSDRRYVRLATLPSKGELDSRSWGFDRRCVPGQLAGQSAAVPGRTLRTRVRSPQNAAVALPGFGGVS